MDTNSSITQPPPRPGIVSVGGGVNTVIKKVGKPPASLILRDAVPMFQCALCGIRYHLVDDLVKHVEKGQHFDIDACLDSGHEVRASSSGASSVTSAGSIPYSSEATERWSATTTRVKRPTPFEEDEIQIRRFARFGRSGAGGYDPQESGGGDTFLRLRSTSSMSGRGAGQQQRFGRKPICTVTSSSMSKSAFEGISPDTGFSTHSVNPPSFNVEEEEEEHDKLMLRHPEAVNPESFPDDDARGPTAYSFRPRKSSLARYRCLKCSLTFDSASELKTHASVHALECDYCDRSFLNQSSLDRHIVKEHGFHFPPGNVAEGEAKPEGPDFEDQFLIAEEEQDVPEQDVSGQDADGQHRAGSSFQSDVLIEELEGCYRCTVCQKVCAARSDMQKHVRRHTDERPYSCGICSERFKHRSAITNHLRIHTGERPYSCIYCGKQFSQHSNKRRHESLHRGERPFRCVLCGRTFSEKTTLQTHMLQHTGERPFICELCQKGHITKSALTRHKCIHKRRPPGRRSSTVTSAEGDKGGSLDSTSGTGTGTEDSVSYSSQ